MSDFICTCQCGAKLRVSEFALGMKRKCTQCGAAFVIGPENTVSLEAPPLAHDHNISARSAADAKAAAGPDRCARCANAFKGEWDRYSASIGMVCHICSSLIAQELAPGEGERPKPLHAPPSTPDPLDKPVQTEPMEVYPETLWDQFEEFRTTKAFRIGLRAAAGLVIFAAVYYTVLAPPEPIDQASSAEISETDADTFANDWVRLGFGLLGPPREMTKGKHICVAICVWTLSFVLGLLPTFLAILLTHLSGGGGLPGSSPWAAVVHIAGMSLIVTACFALPSLIGISTSLPFLLFYILLLVVAWLTVFYLLHETYNFRLSECCLFALLKFVLSFAIYPLRMLVFGIAGLIFF